ncbi:MAG: CidA/LrgA family protein [Clostridia bacterium]
MKTMFKTVAQVLFFVILAKLANLLVQWLHLPVPGSILGILMMFILLKCNVIQLNWIDSGAKWLIAEMLLFFIPSVVGIINYKELVLHSGLGIASAIIFSAIVVMISSGLAGQFILSYKERAAK